MVQKRYIVLPIAIAIGMTLTARAQDFKDGTCPANNANNRYSILSSNDSFSGTEDLNQLTGHSGFAAPEYSPMLLNATAFGGGAVGTFPISDRYILRASIIALSSSSSFGLAQQNSEGVLMPVEFGLRIPIVHSILGTMDYTLYGETTAGLLLGMAVPTGGSFLSYSLPNSRFSTGASAYLGLGNTLRFDRYVGLYLNGGAGYFDLFSSTFMPRTNYLYPSISVGFLFNIAP
jgi:hypothetical protein